MGEVYKITGRAVSTAPDLLPSGVENPSLPRVQEALPSKQIKCQIKLENFSPRARWGMQTRDPLQLDLEDG